MSTLAIKLMYIFLYWYLCQQIKCWEIQIRCSINSSMNSESETKMFLYNWEDYFFNSLKKRDAAFCNVKLCQQLKHVASLIKFYPECENIRYRVSLRKVTITMAIPVKRLHFFIFYRFKFTNFVADSTLVVWIHIIKNSPPLNTHYNFL